MKRLGFVLPILLLLLGCEPKKIVKDFPVGVIVPLSGTLANTLGAEVKEGILLAESMFADHPLVTVNGNSYRIRLYFEDDKNLPEEGLFAARKLINQTGVEALICGSFSPSSLPVSLVAEAQRVPLFVTIADHPEIAQEKKYTFSLASPLITECALMTAFARSDLRKSRATALFDVTNRGDRAAMSCFRAQWIASGGTWVGDFGYIPDSTTVGEIYQMVSNSSAEIVLLPGAPDRVYEILDKWPQIGGSAIPIGLGSYSLVQPYEAHFPVGYYVAPALISKPAQGALPFIAAFQKAYNHPPSLAAASAFDAYLLLRQALSGALGATAEDLAAVLQKKEGFHVPSLAVSVWGEGDPGHFLRIHRVATEGITALEYRLSP